MPYETYEEKWVWDTPMKGLVNEDIGIPFTRMFDMTCRMSRT